MNFKICDFGIAQLLDDGTDGMETKHRIMGTPGWIAPESKKGILGTAADIWGLGAVLFMICTIVQRKYDLKPYRKEKNGDLNFTDDYNAEDFLIDHTYSGKLKDMIASMLHPDWTKRPSAKEIFDQANGMDHCEGSFKQGEEHFAFLSDFKDVDLKT
jgi:serine/threonine protein kinase